MWVDKNDVFADDKVWEFKASNPDTATHIRSTTFAKSPHPPTPTHSQLLYQHTLSYMSSDGNNDLAHEYPAGAIADSPIPLSQENPNIAPVPVHATPIIDFATMRPLSSEAPVFSPRPVTSSSSTSDIATMFRQLRVHTPAPLTPDGQHAADQAAETFVILLTPAGWGGHEASLALALSPATRSETSLGATATAPDLRRSDSYDWATNNDLRCCVTCRWHVLLDVSWVGSVANSAKVTVLRSDPEPLLS
jgi:hypothetical protein